MVLLMAGCATPGPRSQYLERIEPEGITNLTAYYADDTVEIHYPIRGKDTFAHANWSLMEDERHGYRCQFSVLSFDKEKRATRKSVVNRNNRLNIRDATEWK